MRIKSRWKIYVSLLLLIIVAGILRFYLLGTIPPGITDDEANIGYDAYSLLKTGKDQWGISYPIFSFKGFGDYRSPVYTYLITPLLTVVELTPYWLRFPAALLGTMTIPLVFLIAKKLGFSVISAFMASIFLAVNPWHVGMSRTAMVIIPGLFTFCLSMALLLNIKKSLFVVILSSVFFGFTIYAYPAYLAVTPITMIFIFIILLKEKNISKTQIAYGLLVFLLIITPYLISSRSSSYGVRLGQVNMFKDSGTINLLNEKLGSCQRILPVWLCKVTYNRYSAFGMKFIDNSIKHISPNLLFSDGTSTQYSILPKRGLLFSTEFLFFVIGLFYLILNNKKIVPMFILVVLLFSLIPDSLTGPGHYGRYFVILPFIQLAGAYGIGRLKTAIGSWIVIPIAFGLIMETIFFSIEYLTFYPYTYSRYSHYGYYDLSKYLQKAKDEYSDIYVSGRVHDAKQYIFYLFYTRYDPVQFQSGIDIEKNIESDGWIRVSRIGNIHFLSGISNSGLPIVEKDKKILYIADPSEFPKIYIPSVHEIYDKRGDVVFKAVTLYDWKFCLENECKESIK